ncbi:MAG: nitroreductase family protein [Traorella sp.]
MINETLMNLSKRFSCGAFESSSLEKEKIDAIVQAALHSPSGTNAQPYRIVIVTNQALLQEMETETMQMMAQTPAYKGFYEMVQSSNMKLFYDAPCMIVLPIDSKNPYSKYDCGIVAQSIAIAAQSLGVASHIIAINELVFEGDKASYFKEKMYFPENYEFGLAILLGYAKKEKEPHKIDLSKLIYVE